MNRRKFLQGVSALGATAALPRLTPKWEANPHGFKKAVKIGMVGEGATLTGKFLLLRDLGYALTPAGRHNVIARRGET